MGSIGRLRVQSGGYGCDREVTGSIGRLRVRSPQWKRSLDFRYRHQVLVLGPGNGLESVSNKP
ncbi:hypothetical protein DPMN_018851 [Dreissena polymorpha]|uniref:Uncharacterized protein n=1 Tax=Dreissena polymorpha TaxID=45954 RepID=A0A9D4NJK6_DREPO|nr:hypothetical protein DPMN_018851 [Dreissena polymorpha]